MLDGIQVLNQTEISSEVGSTFLFYMVADGIILFVFVSVFLYFSIKEKGWGCESAFFSVIAIVLIVFTVFTASSICSFEKRVDIPRYQYEVLIDDDADWNAIYQKYDIVDAKGNIYIIRDKEGDELK